MSQPRTTLPSLYEELRTIEVFDRIYDYATHADPANEHLYATRQLRREKIMEEIATLKAHKSKSWKSEFWKPALWRPAGLSGAIAIACAVGYTLLYYSLK
jgi:hypothetical protein